MKNELNKMDDKTSIKNFKEAVEMGMNGYKNISTCDDFYLTSDICKDNGKLGGKPIMSPYAFVRRLPSDNYPYIILISKGKSYKNPKGDAFETYETGYGFIFRVFKDERGALMLAEANVEKSKEIIEYTKNNNYWIGYHSENSR